MYVGNVKEHLLINQTAPQSFIFVISAAHSFAILRYMQTIFLVIGGVILLLIVNAFLGGNPLG